MKISIIYFCLLLSTSLSLLGAPPANDNFENAILLSGLTPSSLVHIQDATTQPGEPADGVTQSVWWKYRPVNSGRLTCSTVGSSGFYGKIDVYLGISLSNLRAVEVKEGWNPISRTFPVVANTDYYFRVGNEGSSTNYYGDTLSFGLSLDDQTDVSSLNIPYAATMSNDLFSQRILLTGTTVAAIGYNLSASNEVAASEPTTSGYYSLWWTYRPSASGRLTISTIGSNSIFYGPGMNTTVSVYLGDTLPTLRLVATKSANPVSLSFPVTANTDYHISLGGSGTYDEGSLVLAMALDSLSDVSELNFPARASSANDSFSQQVSLSGSTLSAIGYNVAATRQSFEPTTYEKTVWWNWTAPSAGTALIDLAGSDPISKRVSVWTGSTISALTAVATSTAASAPTLSFTAIAGTTYRIAVGNSSTSTEGGSVVMSIAAPPGPPGENVPDLAVGTAFHIKWFAISGLKYQVQKSQDLSTWNNVGAMVVGNGAFKDHFDPMAGQKSYYRVFVQP